jgi:peptidoglycan/xylan/chitin deacetylase (PgdA/CDA1 family)
VSLPLFLKRIYTIPVIMYHSINNTNEDTDLFVTPKEFERQIAFLRKNGYNIASVGKIALYMSGKERMPAKTIAVTIDDGFYSTYRYAWPVLKKYEIPATIFVITGKIGEPGWLGWKELKEMSESGFVTIGAHTISHGWLPTMDEVKVRHEIEGSKKALESGLGKRIDYFCYPLGGFNERVKKMVEEGGYKCAVATNPPKGSPNNDIYAIKRIKISRRSDNLFSFWIKTTGYYTWIKEIRDD